MDRLIAAAVRLSDRYPKIVAAHGAVSGEINGHVDRITPQTCDLNWAACYLKIFSVLSSKPPKPELQDSYIGYLWRRYRPLAGRDDHADLIVALIRKLVVQQARNIPYGSWRDRLTHPLRTYGISLEEWEDGT